MDIIEAASDWATSALWHVRRAIHNFFDWLRWHLAPVSLTGCSDCGELARWDYAPADSPVMDYCEACVPRGCDCRLADGYPKNGEGKLDRRDSSEGLACFLVREDGSEVELDQRRDEQGRLLPCCEFEFYRWGFPRRWQEERGGHA